VQKINKANRRLGVRDGTVLTPGEQFWAIFEPSSATGSCWITPLWPQAVLDFTLSRDLHLPATVGEAKGPKDAHLHNSAPTKIFTSLNIHKTEPFPEIKMERQAEDGGVGLGQLSDEPADQEKERGEDED
jgi:hypothetical protein